MPTLRDRLAHAWNAFSRPPVASNQYSYYDTGIYQRPDRIRLHRGNEKSIVAAIYNRIAIDAAAIELKHVRLDDNNERYIDTIYSGLNECLTTEANLDQTGRAMIQDLVMSMCDEGCVALVPVQTTIDPRNSGSYDITELRVAKIIGWKPDSVILDLYNEKTGKKEQILLPKRIVCIIENPLYAVMNEPNSTLQRLIRKLNILDAIDEQSGAGKLDIIIQLPYTIRSEARREQAEERRKDIEMQLANTKYGIAYADATERITQLNRPAENNLLSQIQYLTNLLFGQLGITEEILNGTADEATMLNYYNRTIEPILAVITEEMTRKFLTKTARTQHQTIKFFRDPFKLVPVGQIADIADKFTRNAILTSNEFRGIVGYKPSDNPDADVLRNKNLNLSNDDMQLQGNQTNEELNEEGKENLQNGTQKV